MLIAELEQWIPHMPAGQASTASLKQAPDISWKVKLTMTTSAIEYQLMQKQVCTTVCSNKHDGVSLDKKHLILLRVISK